MKLNRRSFAFKSLAALVGGLTATKMVKGDTFSKVVLANPFKKTGKTKLVQTAREIVFTLDIPKGEVKIKGLEVDRGQIVAKWEDGGPYKIETIGETATRLKK
jgi:hypothetical protein